MNKNDEIINDILIKMMVHLSPQLLTILKDVLLQTMNGIVVTKESTEISTYDNTNTYIIELFNLKKAEKLSKGTVEQYMRHIRLLIALIQKPLTQISESDIEYFLALYKKKGNSNCTVNNCKRYLSAFFTWMRKARLITENPVESIDNYKESGKRIEHMEPEQWEQLKIGCKNTRDRALIEFLRCTALRDGEVPQIHISDVDWSDGKITVYGQKSDKYRLVCIDRVAKKYLLKYLEERSASPDSAAALFSSDNGRTLSKGGIYLSIKMIAKRAKMGINVYPHLIRKTTATNIIRRGGSVEEAGEYLGHAERNTAGKYYAYKGEEHIMDIFRRRVAAV